MSLFTFPVIGTVLLVLAVIARRRWIRLLTGLALALMIAYILLFYTGSIARAVLQPGPPAGNEVNGFYLGIQLLQNALLNSYFAAIYLSCLSFLNSIEWQNSKPN